MSSDMPKLPDDLRALLDAERRRPDVAADEVASIWSGVERAVDLGGPPTPSGGGDGGATPPAAPSGGLGGLVQAHPKVALLAALAIGGATGSAVTAALRLEPPPTVVQIPSAAPKEQAAPSATQAPAPVEATSVPVASATAGVRAAASVAPKASGDRDANLGAERALVERARSALSRGAPADAIAAAKEHVDRFPNGRLAEERDFLWIQALVAQGATAEARARAATFRARYPQSLLVPTLDPAPPTSSR